MVKICPGCKKKPKVFSKKGNMYGYCRECRNAVSRKSSEKPEHKESKNNYDRKYSRDYRIKHPEWKKMDNKRNLPLSNRLVREWNERYPEKRRALLLVQKAIKKGILVRGKCTFCHKEKTDGHHPDYSKPLEVVWMCHSCHKKYHFGLLKMEDLKVVSV